MGKKLNYQYVDSSDALSRCCESARKHAALALDTEFVRTRTYYPQAGLIQMYDGQLLTLIDPLSIENWQPFIDLLNDRRVTKYLHAGSEDLELFLHMFGCLPEPFIDTQVLAAFCGYSLSCGFAALIAQLEGVALDKSESRTDWLARPLTARQCDYAAADVWYLLPAAEKLMAQVEENGLLNDARNECELLAERRKTVLQPRQAWRKIRQFSQLNPRQLAALERLAAWRLTTARQQDRAVNFVVREENLWKVARFLPTSLSELNRLGLSSNEIRYHGKTLLCLVAQAMAQEILPAPVSTIAEHPQYRQAFNMLKGCIADVSRHCGIQPELMASRRQINQLLSWHWQLETDIKRPELLSGWREKRLKAALETALAAC